MGVDKSAGYLSAWRREQMEISNDIAGLPRDSNAMAMVAALDALDLTAEQRITAMTAYFKSLAASAAPPSATKN